MSDQMGPTDSTDGGQSPPLSEAAPGVWVRASVSEMLAPGRIVGRGRFVLNEFIARGGMGAVWKAKDRKSNDLVALKFPPPELAADQAALEDMRKEVGKTRRLCHLNIVRIDEIFEVPGELPFFAMEYVEGASLGTLRASRLDGLLKWEEIEPVVTQLCAALQYAHNQKLVHRDLKPSNLLLTLEGTVKLADFGVAAVVSSSLSRLTAKSGSSGTPTYMSPQQMNSSAARVTDDIYSLGATLYELLTSRPPFYTGDIYRQVQDLPAIPLKARLADLGITNEIPADVESLVMACLAKEPQQRPQSAVEVAQRLGLALESYAKCKAKALAQFLANVPRNSPSTDLESVPGTQTSPRIEHQSRRSSRPVVWITAVGGIACLAALPLLLPHSPGESRVDDSPSSRRAQAIPVSVRTNSQNTPFISLFNGRDLAGWKDENGNWSVKDGCLQVQLNNQAWSFLNWAGGSLTNFELHLSCRISHRVMEKCFISIGERVKDGDADSYKDPAPGYWHVISPNPYSNGRIDVGRDGAGTWSEAHFDKPELYRDHDWNEVVITAKDKHITFTLNGVLLADKVHDDPVKFSARGGLRLLVWQAAPGNMTVEFKDIRLKQL